MILVGMLAASTAAVTAWLLPRPGPDSAGRGGSAVTGAAALAGAEGEGRRRTLREDLRRRRQERLTRAAARAHLPHLVGLVAVGVEAGAPVPHAVKHACEAFGGPVAQRLSQVAEQVERGADPARAWAELSHDPTLGPVGRALARSARTGSSVVDTLALLADDLAQQTRAGREDAARTVGVKAAVPLGLCLLPAFLLLGIVPLVAGLASQLALG